MLKRILVAILYSGLTMTCWTAANAQNKPEEPKPAPSPRLGNELDGVLFTHTDLVTLTVTVTDPYGRYVSGLNKNAFTVLDQKQPQEITYFSDADAPVSVGVIFDLSGSMGGDKINRAREALLMGLRLAEGVDLATLAAATGLATEQLLDRQAVDRLVAADLLAVTPERLAATPAGRQRLNAVLQHLLA